MSSSVHTQPVAPCDIYLGDGVYASFDGYGVVLDLRAQGPDKITLEPEVIRALVDYATKLGIIV